MAMVALIAKRIVGPWAGPDAMRRAASFLACLSFIFLAIHTAQHVAAPDDHQKPPCEICVAAGSGAADRPSIAVVPLPDPPTPAKRIQLSFVPVTGTNVECVRSRGPPALPLAVV